VHPNCCTRVLSLLIAKNSDLRSICPSAPPCVCWCLLALPVVLASISITPRLSRLPLRSYFGSHCRDHYLHVLPNASGECGIVQLHFSVARIARRHHSVLCIPGTWKGMVFPLCLGAAAATRVAPAPEFGCGLVSMSKTSSDPTRDNSCEDTCVGFIVVFYGKFSHFIYCLFSHTM
jgi:hypothetical protein